MLFVNRPWGYGSVGRAMRSQRIGHEFESRYLHQKNKNAINLRSFFCEIPKTVNPTEGLAFEKRLRFQWFVLFLSDIPSERAVFCLVFETLRKFYKR